MKNYTEPISGSFNHRHSSELWDIVSEILTELSRRDNVEYRIGQLKKY